MTSSPDAVARSAPRPSQVARTESEAAAIALAAGLGLLACVLAAWTLARQLPFEIWLGAALRPDAAAPAELVFHFAALPRLATAVLAGAALGATGTIFQHVLRNPLASPVTLGVSSGAQLAVVCATIFAPALLERFHDLVALAGGLGTMALVLGIAAARRFSSLALVLAGLAVGLFCGALGHALKLFNQEYMAAIFLWGAGSLDQTDWSVPAALLPRLALLAAMTALLLRPLRLLGLGDEHARGLGMSLTVFRAATLAVAVGFAAVTVASVGMIAFVEIAAPLVARLAGARRLGTRLLLAAAIGAALLVIVDTLVQALDRATGASLPTGAATAFLAAPLLLALLPRMRGSANPADTGWSGGRVPAASALRVITTLAALAAGVAALSLLVGRIGTDWAAPAHDLPALLPWRLPRSVVAFAAGAMLGAAGTLLQRATGNPLAGPEVLGLGAATVAGLAIGLVVLPSPGPVALFAAGAAGAFVLLIVLTGFGWRARFAPDHILLTGIALTAALDAVIVAFLALNDARAGVLLGFMSGSTGNADAGTALALGGLALLLIPLGFLLTRGLDLLPLGDAMARGLGLALAPVRFGVMGLAALLTASAVLAVGPLTFVGLVGPHIARRLGLARAALQLPGAALAGGLVMLLADWLGRVALSPFEVPAGLVASLIGCPYLIAQLRRRGS